MVYKVILDTNFLMIPGQVGTDVFEEVPNAFSKPVKLFVCSGSLKELEELTTKGKGADKRAAKLALQLVDFRDPEVIETGEKHVDDALVELANEGYWVATQDLELKRRLKNFIYMRQKKFIEIRGSKD
ncbi:MAG: PIN domain-containing protein [Nanoarchaeota archaeon]